MTSKIRGCTLKTALSPMVEQFCKQGMFHENVAFGGFGRHLTAKGHQKRGGDCYMKGNNSNISNLRPHWSITP